MENMVVYDTINPYRGPRPAGRLTSYLGMRPEPVYTAE